MADNELTHAIHEAIDRRYRSAENLATEAGLAAGTVRNILRSGSGAPDSLIKLAPLLGRSAFEMFVLAGWLAPMPTHLSAEAEEAARLIEAAPAELRPLLLDPVVGLARRLQEPEFQRATLSYLQATNRLAD